MKNNKKYLSEIEELNLEDWTLKEETSTSRVYHKNGIDKKLQIFDNYTLEENYKDGKLNGCLIGRMKKPFFHYPNHESTIYLIEKYKDGLKEGVSENFYDDGSKTRQEWKNDQLDGKWEEWFGNGQKEKENFVNGIQAGESVKYLENGKLKRKKFYKNGKIIRSRYPKW